MQSLSLMVLDDNSRFYKIVTTHIDNIADVFVRNEFPCFCGEWEQILSTSCSTVPLK